MDSCPYVRLAIGNLGLHVPLSTKPDSAVVRPSSSPCFCQIKLKNFVPQIAVVPYVPLENHKFPEGELCPASATFHLSKSYIDSHLSKTIFSGTPRLKFLIYTGSTGTTCGIHSGRLVGKVSVSLDLTGTESKPCVFYNGWISVGKEYGHKEATRFHLIVKADPDPRFVFQFDAEPECSPQVFQIQGTIRQPVFTCKFSFRNTASRPSRSWSFQSQPSGPKGWLSSFASERVRAAKERKGWSITVHDLSGSPVALASMVTPFVATASSDRVTRSNPGSWLILRPADATWVPWGRLEAWRETNAFNEVGFRFLLIPDTNVCTSAAGYVLVESTLSSNNGGTFVIDTDRTDKAGYVLQPSYSPSGSPKRNEVGKYRGFVMSAIVGGANKCSKPSVEISVRHVSCAEDAATFVALAAAVDLSIDACRLFSRRLRKELRQDLDFHRDDLR